MRDMERKRAYDRDRMARLHAEGETWWQQQEDLRWYYDQARSRDNYSVGLCESSMGALRQARELMGDGYVAEETAWWADRLASAKQRRRENSRGRFAEHLAKVEWLPCYHCGEQAVAGYKEHNRTFAVHARCLREVSLIRQAELEAAS